MADELNAGLSGNAVWRNKTIRSLILLNILFAAAIGVLVVMIVSAHRKQSARLSRDAIRQVSRETSERIFNFFSPLEKQLMLLREWSERGVLQIHKPELLKEQLLPLLRNNPQIYSAILANSGGWVFGAFHGQGEWRLLTGASGESSPHSLEWWILNAAGEMVRKVPVQEKYDPREKIWFRQALEKNPADFVFTEPYGLFPDRVAGITLSLGWQKEHLGYVAAISIVYDSVRALAQHRKLKDVSRVFIFSGNRILLDLGQVLTHPVEEGEAQILEKRQVTADTVISTALRVWKKSGYEEEPFPFHLDGTTWWAYLRRFDPRGTTGLAWVIPQEALLRGYSTRPYSFILVILSLLWMGLLVFTVRFVGRERKRARARDVTQMSETELLQLIEAGESDRVEFKSTLRWNLKSDKPGKEIELASLKTIAAFLNSDGGILFVGVDDDGNPLGIELDRFPNHDRYLRHFGSIFNQHIGLDFAEHVRFAIRQVKGKDIFVVQCLPSPRPVFLKHKEQEMFFIRSGPASRQLSMSQLLQYVKERKMQI